MRAKLIKWALVSVVVLGGYATAERRGWAFGGSRAPEPVKREDLRSGTPGSWHYVYWYHGTRGK